MRRYKVLLPLTVHTEDGAYGQFKEFDKDFSEADERTNVESGLLEIVPREYKVVGPHEVLGTAPGKTVTCALLMGHEASLIEAGHLEPVEAKPKKPRKDSDRGD